MLGARLPSCIPGAEETFLERLMTLKAEAEAAGASADTLSALAKARLAVGGPGLSLRPPTVRGH